MALIVFADMTLFSAFSCIAFTICVFLFFFSYFWSFVSICVCITGFNMKAQNSCNLTFLWCGQCGCYLGFFDDKAKLIYFVTGIKSLGLEQGGATLWLWLKMEVHFHLVGISMASWALVQWGMVSLLSGFTRRFFIILFWLLYIIILLLIYDICLNYWWKKFLTLYGIVMQEWLVSFFFNGPFMY